MQLTGSFGLLFTRRLAITLKHYDLHYSQVKLTPFGEGKDALRTVNPLTRVPVMSLGRISKGNKGKEGAISIAMDQ